MAMRPLLLLLALRFCARGAETAGGVAAVGEAAVVAEADATAVAADGEQTAVLSAFAAILTQPTLKALYNCSCATAPRFYIFEQKHAIRAGLAHQFSNLEALIAEGLSLGRAVLLDAPRLSGRHVNGKPQMHEAWTSFISLERSTFHLKSRGKDVCKGLLSSCVAEVTRRQISALTADDFAFRKKVEYHAGAVPASFRGASLVHRGYRRNPTKGEAKDQANLIRKLPGFADLLANFSLTLTLAPSDLISEAALPVFAALKNVAAGKPVVVVHARRGDKVLRAKYCPFEMAQATSPEHMARTLMAAGFARGTALYIMSDERNASHFEPLRGLGFPFFSAASFSHLSDLVKGCPAGSEGPCENYFLFQTENHILRSVSPDHRILTMANSHVPHAKVWLMKDFGSACHDLHGNGPPFPLGAR